MKWIVRQTSGIQGTYMPIRMYAFFRFNNHECGTLYFFAPVILMDSPYICRPDFWAMGCRKHFVTLPYREGWIPSIPTCPADHFSAKPNAIVLVWFSNQLKIRNADLVDSITVGLFYKGTKDRASGSQLTAGGIVISPFTSTSPCPLAQDQTMIRPISRRLCPGHAFCSTIAHISRANLIMRKKTPFHHLSLVCAITCSSFSVPQIHFHGVSMSAILLLPSISKPSLRHGGKWTLVIRSTDG